MSKNNFHIAVLSAMPEEISSLKSKLINIQNFKLQKQEIISGIWKEELPNSNEIRITSSWSGWGKVNSAQAATKLIYLNQGFPKIDLLIFTGVAGAADNNLNQWDIVVGDALIQHDMDASPIFPKYVIPNINKSLFKPKKEVLKWAFKSLKELENKVCFKKIYGGTIATGDKFITDKENIISLKGEITNLFAVEMEGASVAQVCFSENIPWLIVRVISDSANDNAVTDFNDFVSEYESKSWLIIQSLLKNINHLEIK